MMEEIGRGQWGWWPFVESRGLDKYPHAWLVECWPFKTNVDENEKKKKLKTHRNEERIWRQREMISSFTYLGAILDLQHYSLCFLLIFLCYIHTTILIYIYTIVSTLYAQCVYDGDGRNESHIAVKFAAYLEKCPIDSMCQI